MEFLLIILGFILTVLFFLNIKSAADILCRIAGGFALLIFYNMCAPVLSLAAVGVNIFSALICGTLGIPGGILLVCCSSLFS